MPWRSSLPRAVIHSTPIGLARCLCQSRLRTLGMAIGYNPDSFHPSQFSSSSSATTVSVGFSLTRTSTRSSSGMSVSLAPWNLGITSCASHSVRIPDQVFCVGAARLGVLPYLRHEPDRDSPEPARRRKTVRQYAGKGREAVELTAWPRLSGWISRKAKTFSLSKSLKEGMSPALRKIFSRQIDAATVPGG